MLFGLTMGLVSFVLLFCCGFYIFEAIGLWKIFEKTGEEGWKGLIPFYRYYILGEITESKSWLFWIFLGCTLLTPSGVTASIFGLAALAVKFVYNYNLSIKFKKDPVLYGILCTLFPYVLYMILGCSDDEFNKNAKVSAFGPISEDKVGGTPNTAFEEKHDEEPEEHKAKSKKSDGKAHFCKNCGAPIKDEKFCTKCGTQLH